MLTLPEHRPAAGEVPRRRRPRPPPQQAPPDARGARRVRPPDGQPEHRRLASASTASSASRSKSTRSFSGPKYRDRFVIFANIDWQGDGKADEPATWDCHRPDFARRMALALADAKERGASGLKIFKDLGLVYRNPDGSLIAVDDPRWDPIWKACGELGLPVLIHAADPAAFFQPVDRFNERWEELHRHPEWSFAADRVSRPTPSCSPRSCASSRAIRKRSFIGAHIANNPENLAELGEWLDKYPNLNVEIAARIAELGRQPFTAREFFLKYADRILFGTDGPRDVNGSPPTGASSKPPTNTSPTPRTSTPRKASGTSTASTSPTTCCGRSTTKTPPASSPASTNACKAGNSGPNASPASLGTGAGASPSPDSTLCHLAAAASTGYIARSPLTPAR